MYIIRSLSMANHLVRNGHDILKVEDSEKDPRFKVFLFEDSAALHNTMKQFHGGVIVLSNGKQRVTDISGSTEYTVF